MSDTVMDQIEEKEQASGTQPKIVTSTLKINTMTKIAKKKYQ